MLFYLNKILNLYDSYCVKYQNCQTNQIFLEIWPSDLVLHKLWKFPEEWSMFEMLWTSFFEWRYQAERVFWLKSYILVDQHIEVFTNNTTMTFLPFLYKLTSRGFKKYQQKIDPNLHPEGIGLATLTITGLEVWCLSNCANQTFVE